MAEQGTKIANVSEKVDRNKEKQGKVMGAYSRPYPTVPRATCWYIDYLRVRLETTRSPCGRHTVASHMILMSNHVGYSTWAGYG